MTKTLTLLFQIMIVLIGIAAFTFMLWEPNIEGRNAHATLFEIYFKDPFLAYAYVSSIPFFVALGQAFMALGGVRQGKTSSPAIAKALRTIKYCAIALAVLVAAAVAYLIIVVRGEDDIAGGVAIGLFLIIVSTLGASAAAVFERRLQSGVDSRSKDEFGA